MSQKAGNFKDSNRNCFLISEHFKLMKSLVLSIITTTPSMKLFNTLLVIVALGTATSSAPLDELENRDSVHHEGKSFNTTQPSKVENVLPVLVIVENPSVVSSDRNSTEETERLNKTTKKGEEWYTDEFAGIESTEKPVVIKYGRQWNWTDIRTVAVIALLIIFSFAVVILCCIFCTNACNEAENDNGRGANQGTRNQYGMPTTKPHNRYNYVGGSARRNY